MKYCTYLTHYTGTKLPEWYIGSTTCFNIIVKKYTGSCSSRKWKLIYESERKLNPHNFKVRILSRFSTRIAALEEELRLQKLHNVVKNAKYFNEALATVNGCFGRDVSGELNPMYGTSWKVGKTKGEIAAINSTKASAGEKNGMYGKTHTKAAIDKIIECNRQFNKTAAGKDKLKKAAERLSKLMKGVPKSDEQKKKMSESAKEHWASVPIVKCPHCSKTGKKGGAMTRYHFDNCKHQKFIKT